MNVLNQPVLCLNRNWQGIGHKTVKEALIAMTGGSGDGAPAALAVDLDFEVNANGEVLWDNLLRSQPVAWDEWITLPVRDFDMEIHSANMSIRAPRVIIQPNFAKMPVVKPRPTKDAIRKRDGGIDQYTGKEVSWKDGNIDHIIPRAQGGKNTFENMVWTHKDINTKKADRTPDQAGLKLIRKPVAPKAVPISATLNIAHHPSWIHFLENVTQVKEIAN